MGVDSGLKTYRGRNAGVWEPAHVLGLGYTEMCDPDWFDSDPRLAWAYWHACQKSYREATPHMGYEILAKWGRRLPLGCFSVTTNIDGHWARVLGPDRVLECHGGVERLQSVDGQGETWSEEVSLDVPVFDLRPDEAVEVRCAVGQSWGPWEAAVVGDDGFSILSGGERRQAHAVRRPQGPDLLRVLEGCPLPQARSGAMARPNVLMFGDFRFNDAVVSAQREAYNAWLGSLPGDGRLVVVEVGAGRAIPVARDESEQAVRAFPNSTIIRINLDDHQVGSAFARRAVSIGGLGAAEALRRIDELLALSA